MEKIAAKARQFLSTNYVPPQRYGTAFHIRPPVLDVRDLARDKVLNSEIELSAWDELSAADQARLEKLDESDVYGLWHWSRGLSTRLLHLSSNISQTLTLADFSFSSLLWIVLETGAKLTIEDTLRDKPLALRRVVVIQHEASEFTFTALRAGIDFLNEQLTVHLVGREAKTKITHVLHGVNRAQTDLAVSVHHEAPATTSLLTSRAAVRDKALAVYRGLIDIHQSAPGSRGYQQGRSLLLSDGAVADALPKLLINTDDVQCSHGVTTTHLDDESLFYLRSRGLQEQTARHVATLGFFHDQLAISPAIGKELEDVIATES